MSTSVSLPPILLVEDNPMDLDLTLRAFSKKKFTNHVQVARDGEEALQVRVGEDNLHRGA